MLPCRDESLNSETLCESLAVFWWIYDFKITQFFIKQIWNYIPSDWLFFLSSLNYDELNYLPFKEKVKLNAPELLQQLIVLAEQAHNLFSNNPCHLNSSVLESEMSRGMNNKKQHEVSLLTAEVVELCARNDLQHIVDIGSGLGYLGQVLYKKYGYHVLGLEANKKRAEKSVQKCDDLRNCKSENNSGSFTCNPFILNVASENDLVLLINKWYSQSQAENKCRVLLKNSENTPGTTSSLVEQIESSDESVDCKGKVCMIGLHSCGDLIPIMIRQFCKLSEVKVLACLSCCYHKMSQNKDSQFLEFPMSSVMKEIVDRLKSKYPLWKGFTPYAMRLAAQETRLRWVKQSAYDHEQHMKNVAYRAVVESYYESITDEQDRKKRLRRPVSLRHSCCSFDSYLDSISFDDDRTAIMSLHNELEPYFKFIEPITCLQVIVQPIIESLILIDRVQFLKEAGFNAYLKPLFNQEISPRNTALIATKN